MMNYHDLHDDVTEALPSIRGVAILGSSQTSDVALAESFTATRVLCEHAQSILDRYIADLRAEKP
uniref:Uncharacterized protein n=1 Tax=Haliea sp. ETY-M TaxID=1055105 RepID=A0A455R1T7_9GAMM|nr:hypothetical protein [Haliea sp. ETY-M]